jgi:hypothetical protein
MKYIDFYSDIVVEAGQEGGAAKKFEDDIVTLALLSTEYKDKSLDELYDSNISQFLAPTKRKQTIKSVTVLNDKFGRIWTKGYNANFAPKSNPKYGVSSAKCDIVLNDNLPISVKLEGGYVVASAQNKEEFLGVFISALDYYLEQNDVTISDKTHIDKLKKLTEEVSKNLIGLVKTRKIKSDELYQKGIKLSKTDEATLFFNKMKEKIDEQQSTMIDEYEKTNEEIKKYYVSEMVKLLNSNQTIKQYIVWEGLTSSLKYNFNLPHATYVLSPSGIYDISSPNKPFVKACASASKFDVRGLPGGVARSGRGTYLKQIIKKITNKEIVDASEILQNLNKMVYGLKFDVRDAQIKPELEKLKNVQENILNEIQLKSIFKNLSKKLENFTKSVIFKLKNFAKVVSDRISKIKKLKPFDILSSFDFDITGEIKIP